MLVLLLSVCVAASVSVHHLHTEYMESPLGLDVDRPRLSWQLDGGEIRGVKQTAFRILVGTASADGSVWDSKEVTGGSTSTLYDGPTLASATAFRWKVEVTVSSGTGETAPVAVVSSVEAAFTMGLRRNDWDGQLIGMDVPSVVINPWFRKEFSLLNHSTWTSATLYVASVGFQEVYVNGQEVTEGVLLPSISYVPKRVMYRTYDVTHLLAAGQNAIGVWLASGWAGYFSMKSELTALAPMLMAELHVITSPGGARTKIVSDATWRWRASTTSQTGDWGTGGFGGDAVDARLAAPGWNAPGFADDGWKAATARALPANVSVSADVMEATVRHSHVAAASVATRPDGAHLVEMDELYTGWFEVHGLEGKEGTTVTFEVSTTKGKDVEYKMADAYTFDGTGKGAFRMRFSYHEIHYIVIKGLSQPPSLGQVIGYRLAVNLTRTGAFSCSSPLLTRIYDTTVNNYLGLTTGGETVDCPHRERRGYGGDGHTSYQFALSNFGVGAYFSKWARDFADVQEPNGHVPNTAPTVSGGGGPAWSGFAITMPWQVYRAHGDTRLLAAMFPAMEALLAFFTANTRGDDGLLHPWTTSKWDFLGDWITPHGSESVPTSPENILFNNCYVRYITMLAGEIAAVLGDSSRADHYRNDAAARARAINKEFYNASGLYVDLRQTHLVMPLAAGVVPGPEWPRVMHNLEHSIRVLQKGHLDTGLTGTYFMVKLLTDVARNDLVFTMANQTTFPGYGYFLEQGYTTWPEDWTLSDGMSKMHGCYNAIGLWFLDGVVGIVVDASNASFPLHLRAGVDAGDVTHASGRRDSMYGPVTSTWAMHPSGFSHDMAIPAGGVAHVLIPASSTEDVKEGGRPVAVVGGVRVLGEEVVNGQRYAALAVGSGVYNFTSSYTRQ